MEQFITCPDCKQIIPLFPSPFAKGPDDIPLTHSCHAETILVNVKPEGFGELMDARTRATEDCARIRAEYQTKLKEAESVRDYIKAEIAAFYRRRGARG